MFNREGQANRGLRCWGTACGNLEQMAGLRDSPPQGWMCSEAKGYLGHAQSGSMFMRWAVLVGIPEARKPQVARTQDGRAQLLMPSPCGQAGKAPGAAGREDQGF